MGRVSAWNRRLTARALDRLGTIPESPSTVHARLHDGARSWPSMCGEDPMELAQALNEAGVESRAGCHCATLAHHALKASRELPSELLSVQHAGGGRTRSRCPDRHRVRQAVRGRISGSRWQHRTSRRIN